MRVTFPDAGVLRPRFRLTPWDLVVVPLVIVAILLLTVAFQAHRSHSMRRRLI